MNTSRWIRIVSGAMTLTLAAHGSWAAAAPATCAELRTQYLAALPAAQQCDTKQANSCAAVRAASLDDACRCEVSINPMRAEQLDRLLTAYRVQGCASEPGLCNRQCLTPVRTCGGASGVTASCGGR